MQHKQGSAAPARPGMLANYYNQHSQLQAGVFPHCQGLLVKAASLVTLPKQGEAVNVAEWGSAAGGNSVAPVITLCKVLQQRTDELSTPDGNKLSVHVSHTDVPSNSWSELFECARDYQQQVLESCPQLQLTFSGIGSNMYSRNHPADSLQLGFTFNSLHWLSELPCRPKRAMTPQSKKASQEEKDAFRRQAEADFRSFLQCRAQEFQSGGILVINMPCKESEEQWPLQALSDCQEAVVDSLVAEGLLAEEELGYMCVPVHVPACHTIQQLLQEASDSWEVLSYETPWVTHPKMQDPMGDKQKAREFGVSYGEMWKAVAFSFCEAGLLECGREPADVQRVLDAYFERLVEAVATAEGPIDFKVRTACILLRRLSRE